MGAAAALLRPSEEAAPAAAPKAAAPRQRAAAPSAPAPSPSEPVPAAPASLWVKRADDGPAREGSLWSR
jgi:hypothetical protein